jgi:hypothetical protein
MRRVVSTNYREAVESLLLSSSLLQIRYDSSFAYQNPECSHLEHLISLDYGSSETFKGDAATTDLVVLI